MLRHGRDSNPRRPGIGYPFATETPFPEVRETDQRLGPLSHAPQYGRFYTSISECQA